MEDKISVILPIFNVGPHLRSGIDSLINQTIGKENLEIIMVNDCSTDGSDKIIEEYAEKYECCVAIHHEKNSGAAHTPRNTGIENSTGDYLMFLDPDDTYSLDTCEKLYDEIKKNDADVAFGRYRRIFTYGGKVEKSYSPYEDNIDKEYLNEKFDNDKSSKIHVFLQDTIIAYILYGKKLKSKYPKNKPVDVVYAKDIEEEPDLLKIAPSVWSKLYKRELIMDNNIRFQPFVSGDDMAFSLESLINANGIVFLNNSFVYNYFIRDLPDDKSITNNINVRLLNELMDSYIYCRKCVDGFSDDIKRISVNPHLFFWFNHWRKGKFTKEENNLLLTKFNILKDMHHVDFQTKFIVSSMINVIKLSNFFKR